MTIDGPGRRRPPRTSTASWPSCTPRASWRAARLRASRPPRRARPTPRSGPSCAARRAPRCRWRWRGRSGRTRARRGATAPCWGACSLAHSPVALAASDGGVRRRVGEAVLELLPTAAGDVPLLVLTGPLAEAAQALELVGLGAAPLRLALPPADGAAVLLALGPDVAGGGGRAPARAAPGPPPPGRFRRGRLPPPRPVGRLPGRWQAPKGRWRATSGRPCPRASCASRASPTAGGAGRRRSRSRTCSWRGARRSRGTGRRRTCCSGPPARWTSTCASCPATTRSRARWRRAARSSRARAAGGPSPCCRRGPGGTRRRRRSRRSGGPVPVEVVLADAAGEALAWLASRPAAAARSRSRRPAPRRWAATASVAAAAWLLSAAAGPDQAADMAPMTSADALQAPGARGAPATIARDAPDAAGPGPLRSTDQPPGPEAGPNFRSSEAPEADASGPAALIEEVRATPGASCRAALFDPALRALRPVPRHAAGYAALALDPLLCGIALRPAVTGPRSGPWRRSRRAPSWPRPPTTAPWCSAAQAADPGLGSAPTAGRSRPGPRRRRRGPAGRRR
jgi:hypothetical protein